MLKVYSAESIVLVAHLRNLLQNAGIRAHIRNERLAGALGEIPFLECWPELWIEHPGDALRARAIIEMELDAPQEVPSPWICRGCGESIGGQFTECGRCGDVRPQP